MLSDYIDEIGTIQGTIFENDIITKLIEQVLQKNKELHQAEETILLIDDLDRIDPEHIFRILNVFAAHFDKHDGTNNKFGFDKIVLVCDIENIRSIFQCKYGISTDFNGYIDKFYSHKIYQYNVIPAISKFAISALYNAKWSEANQGISGDRWQQYCKGVFFKDSSFLSDMLTLLSNNRQIDLRNIFKWKHLEIKYQSNVVFDRVLLIELEKYPVILFLKLLADMKGSLESLSEALNNCLTFHQFRCDIQTYGKHLLYLLLIFRHKRESSDRTYGYHFPDRKVFVRYKKVDESIELNSLAGHHENIDSKDFMFIIKEAVKFLTYNTETKLS
jgi:hypothetical protein